MTRLSAHSHWSLAEALAWVATGDMASSERAAEAETTTALIILLVKSGSLRPDIDPLQTGEQLSLRSVWAEIAEAIGAGRIQASGRPGASYPERRDRRPLGAEAFDVSPDSEPGGFEGVHLGGDGAESWYDVCVDAGALVDVFPAKAGRKNPHPYRTGGAGRPTVMHLVKAESDRRLAAGEAVPASLAELARWAVEWVQATYPEAPTPSESAVRNSLRPWYREAKAAEIKRPK